MAVEIHPTAIVSPQAHLGDGTVVGAYSIIGPKVILGERNRVGPHVVLDGNTKLGNENELFQFCSVGAKPQDLKFHGEDSTLEIGNKNIVRECVTLQPGTEGGGMRTVIGNGNLFMANSHVGHDSMVGDGNIFANCVSLAGHVTVGNYVTLGGLSGIHQFVRLGDLSFIAAGAMVNLDIPPFCMAHGDRAALVGLNVVGIQRKGYSKTDLADLKRLYRSIFFGTGVFRNRVAELIKSDGDTTPKKLLLSFVSDSPRGVTLPRSGGQDSSDED